MNSSRVVLAVLGLMLLQTSVAPSQTDTLRLFSRRDTVPLDPNGFLFNPHWLNAPAEPPNIDKICRFRVLSGHLDERRLVITGKNPCLSADERRVVTINETSATMGFGFICMSNSQMGDVRGHVNWFPVTVTGQLYWSGFESGTGKDFDINFDLASPTPNAITAGNGVPAQFKHRPSSQRKPTYHLEIYNQETLATLPSERGVRAGQLTWWHLLKGSVKEEADMRRLVDGRFAIVTGVFGVDGVHDFQAELHPVLAMAVLLGASRTGAGVREEWAVMVRNRGNEGECAIGGLPAFGAPHSRQTFFLDLGAMRGAATPRVSLGPYWTSDSTVSLPRVRSDAQRLVVAFTYPRPEPTERAYLFLGTLFVDWPSGVAGDPLARLEPWRPQIAESLKLGGVRQDSVVTVGQTAVQMLPGFSGAKGLVDTTSRDTVARGRRPPAETLEALDSTWQVQRRTEPAVAQLVVRGPVTDWCDRRDHYDHPVCTTPFRLMTGVTISPSTTGSVMALASAYWVPRGVGFVQGWPVFESLGYRFDFRYVDRFARSCNACWARVEGSSLRLSGIYAPSTLSLLAGGGITPYFVGGLGAFQPRNARTKFTWGLGVGIEWTTTNQSRPVFKQVVLEVQNYLSSGGLRNYWAVNLETGVSVRFLRKTPRRH